jgi:hypothetical protein
MSDTLELREPVETGDEEGPQIAPPPFESIKWRIKIADKEYGPYPRSRLIDFLKEGRVQAGTFIACGADIDFHRADHHPNLRWDFKGPKKRKFGEPRLDAGETEVPVSNYFVAARLLAGNDRFERVLRESGKMTRAAGDMWVLRSRQTVQQLRNQLTLAMKPHEHFIIVNASKDRLAWYNIGVEADIAVRGVWDTDEVQ